MRVGFTYDLRSDYLAEGYGMEETAEFDSAATIDAIAAALASLGHTVDRIGNVRHLAKRLVAGDRFDLVFNIAEGLHGIARESQVPALLDAYDIPYVFSDPLVLALTQHKGMTKHVIRDCGVPTAPFAVVATMADVAKVKLPYPLFAKPIAEGSGKGINPASRANGPAELGNVCAELLTRFRQPVLVETYLPGREFTVGIVGSGAQAELVGVLEVILTANAEQGVYSYLNKEEYDTRVVYRLVDDDPEGRRAGEVALQAWRALGCRDGGRIDLRSDAKGEPHFLEVNPLAGLSPIKSDLPIMAFKAGWTFEQLIGRITASALTRVRVKAAGHTASAAAE
jgi:D-alanine-D-alanine ligase